MKTQIRYYSRSGNTKKVAEAIAEAVGETAKSVDEALTGSTDILFLGGALYGGAMNKKLQDFIAALTSDKVKQIAVFSTAAGENSIYPLVKAELEGKNIKLLDKQFSCRGKFLLAHRNRPNMDDLNAAKDFAKNIMEGSK